MLKSGEDAADTSPKGRYLARPAPSGLHTEEGPLARILIIDDNPQIGRVLTAYLSRFGYEVEYAQDGSAGLRAYQASVFDLVITDLVMPEEDGLGIIRRILATNPEARIIAVSGGGHRVHAEDYLTLALRLGAKEVLEKPFESAQILEVVREVLSAGE